MPSSSSKTLKSVGHIWMVIFILSIVSFITVLLALFQNEVEFFGEAVWQNNDNIGLGRGYFIVLTTSVLTLLTSSYGHWRACVPAAWVATIDELATRLITANASLCLTSFILFSNILIVFEAGLVGGEGPIFFFAISFFALFILYSVVNVKTLGSSAPSQVDYNAFL